MGRTEFLTPTIRSEPRLEAQTIYESEMALSHECMQSCAHIVLDTADIVREAIFRQLSVASGLPKTRPRNSLATKNSTCAESANQALF
jgi:hypothetical protein